MKTFLCTCDNRLFFGNTSCLKCGKEAGFCPACRRVVALIPGEGDQFSCGNPECGAALRKCHNFAVENVCNGCIRTDELAVPGPDGVSATPTLCQHCRLTGVIPDLNVPGNRELWARLEDAKRRVLFTVELIDLPIGRPENNVRPELKFDFQADTDVPVLTGHDQGKITINIREADDVEREKARVSFHEPQRTLVGHFRHELGHYYWDVLVAGKCEDEFRALFGDERSPDYATALNNYYQTGPKPDWQGSYISAYATMHPWEDFAETFGTYLDMLCILDTAKNMTGNQLRAQECTQMLYDYQQVGILANELNREMGLKDLVPEVFGADVARKICFVHRLAGNAGACSGKEVMNAA
ncbi:zinc-binding metallopeptidase family protein [Planctomicrobium sp. SH661]|uniref:zinc-binding metallopeptidase family protein n=1 Tax=Planctomicrobium sp. SH661 TaxID=3448124 RepID=UPI003F5B6E9D